MRGAQRIFELAPELGFRVRRNGSMVVAFSEEELKVIEELMRRAQANGVSDVRVVGAEQARTLEPNLNPKVMGALVCDASGICDPFGMTVAFAENAKVNGVTFRFLTPVVDIKKEPCGGECSLEQAKSFIQNC